ncbi:MAG: class I SAM-dependent methyltransferase [Bacteroidota bacterium]
MTWYEDWFDSELYELVYASRDERDAERLADLIVRVATPSAGSEILDVGTGRGRHARVLARRGYRVTGLDLSPRAVETARRRAEAAGLADRTAFVTGDMREVQFRETFDGVVNLFSSFGYFEDEADHGRAVRAMAAALRPGGWLVQDLLNPAHLEQHLVPEDEREVGGVHVRQRRRLVKREGRLRVEKEIVLTSREGEPYTTTESVRLFTPDELEALYDEAGLEVCGRFGDYAGGPLTGESPRLILYAQR